MLLKKLLLYKYSFFVFACIAVSFNILDAFHTQNYFRPSSSRFTSLRNNLNSQEDLIDPSVLDRIKEYLKARESKIIKSNPEDKSLTPQYDFLSMFKPAGWYRDKNAIDLAARSDSKVPRILHPFSNVELEKYGFEDLCLPIIELGGPYIVGKMVELDWVEPELPPEVWDESLRPVRKEFYALDFRGTLSLGGALEERLSLAENLNLEELKADLETSKLRNVSTSPTSPYGNANYIYNTNQPKQRPSYSSTGTAYSATGGIIDYSDRFNIPAPQRVYIVFASFLLAFAWGHASQDMLLSSSDGVLSTAVEGARILSLSVPVAGVLSAATSLSASKDKNRNQAVWLSKSLLAGPLALAELKSLPSKSLGDDIIPADLQ